MAKVDVKCEDSINIRASNINSSLEKFIRFHFHNRMSVKLELVGGVRMGWVPVLMSTSCHMKVVVGFSWGVEPRW